MWVFVDKYILAKKYLSKYLISQNLLAKFRFDLIMLDVL